MSIETSIDLPSWIQAGASVLSVVVAAVGIGVAIWVPAWQHKQARDDAEAERRLKARSLAISLRPEVVVLRGAIGEALSKAKEVLAGLPSNDSLGISAALHHAFMPTPREIARHQDPLYIFGPGLADDLMSLIVLLNQYLGVISEAQGKATDQLQPIVTEMVRIGEQALKCADRAASSLKRLVEGAS